MFYIRLRLKGDRLRLKGDRLRLKGDRLRLKGEYVYIKTVQKDIIYIHINGSHF